MAGDPPRVGGTDAAALRAALERSMLAINDWLHTYAHDLCDRDDVARSNSRVQAQGGTLAYIGSVQEQNRAALAAAPPVPARPAGEA